MAKSKEQKQQEALERSQSNYCRYHFPDWISETPIGTWWTNQDPETCLKDWIESTEKLMKQANACGIDLCGKSNTYSSMMKWEAKKVVSFLLAENNLEDLLNEHVEFVRTKSFKGGHHELDIFNADVRTKNIECARETFEKLYPT